MSCKLIDGVDYIELKQYNKACYRIQDLRYKLHIALKAMSNSIGSEECRNALIEIRELGGHEYLATEPRD